MNKQNSNDNKRRISIDDDYIELLNSVDIEDEYEDIYSDSSRDIYSDSSKDVYIGRRKTIDEEDGVYISKRRRKYYEEADLEEADPAEPTQEIEPQQESIPTKRRVRNIPDEDEVSDFEDRHGKRTKKRKNPLLKFVAVLLILAIGLGVFVSSIPGSIAGEFTEGEEIQHIEGVENLTQASHVKNILLIGSDEEKGGASRSDSIMIASVNSKTGKVTIVSILRDTHVDVPGHRESKINAAHTWGGSNLLIQTIEHNFGIKIDDYATVNFDMFEALVDGVGGIYVDVSDAEAEHMNSYFKLGKGNKPPKVEGGENVYLNGYQALCYARIRKLDSDFYRTQRQQKVIGAIVENVKGRLNPAGIPELLDTAKAVAPYIETTLTKSDINSLMLSVGSCVLKSGGDMSSLMVSAQLPFEGTWWYSSEWDGSSISIDLEENKQLLYTLLYEEPSQEETTEVQE